MKMLWKSRKVLSDNVNAQCLAYLMNTLDTLLSFSLQQKSALREWESQYQ